MKPEHWSEMTDEEKDRDARELFDTPRGRWLVGEALAVAIEAMRKEKYPAESDIEDLEELHERLFPAPPWRAPPPPPGGGEPVVLAA